MSCSFVKFSSSIGIFLNSANLICRSTDISKCFRGSLRLRDNESRLYYIFFNNMIANETCKKTFEMGSGSMQWMQW